MYDVAPSWSIVPGSGTRSPSWAHRRAEAYAELVGIPFCDLSLALPPPDDVASYYGGELGKCVAVCQDMRPESESEWGGTYYAVVCRNEEPVT